MTLTTVSTTVLYCDVDCMLAFSNQRLYLQNKLKYDGLDEKAFANIFQAIAVSRILWALPACRVNCHIGRLNLLFRHAHRWQLTDQLYTVNWFVFTLTADNK